MQKIQAAYRILRHLWQHRVVIARPLACARLFMERTANEQEAAFRYGGQRFIARKMDMNSVREVLVDGAYDFMVPFLQSLPHRPVVLDCGANIGSFGLRLLMERPDAQVLSVEAAADTYSILEGNAKSSRSDWRTVHAAVWKSEGRLLLCKDRSSARSYVKESSDDAGGIPARSLPAIRKKFGLHRIDLLKMDIEGAETIVIPASPEAIHAERMIIELHKNHSDPTECCSILAEQYPYALVAPEHLTDKTHPNIVYYLSREPFEAPGLIPVDLMAHLRSVYCHEVWQK